MKVAIVHYWFMSWRGGEKVVKSLLDLYPDADIYTLFLDEEIKNKYLTNHKVYTSFFNKFKFIRKNYQKLFPLYPFAIKSLKLKDNYDLIISSESGPAKGIKINNNAKHICYIHTPMRYCWGYTEEYLKVLPFFVRPFAKFFFWLLKLWDKTTINNVDKYIANSENVRKRVQKFYKKDASVVYPPIDLSLFNGKLKEKNKIGDYYLSFGAITPYKKIDLLVKTFNKLDKKLIIIGEGSEKEKLQKIAKDNIIFKGYLPDEKLEEYIINAKALIFPGEEDFGMVPLEVMSHGVPVIAYAKGGALETVIESPNIEESTGIFFYEQTPEELIKAINKFEIIENKFDPQFIRNHARKFGEDLFKEKIKKEIENLLKKNQ